MLKREDIALFNVAAAGSPGDNLYEHIKAMVTTYRFKPGDRINELALSRQLGVSRTPIRAALNRIAAEGFLTAVSNKGYEMRALDAACVQALFEYRSNLEVGVVRLVCARATDAELEDLARSATQDHGDPLDDDAAIRFLWRDERFHESLAVLSGNEEFLRAVRALNERIRFARWIDIKSRIGSMSRDHLRIVTFLQERDLEAAEALMQVHVARRIEQIVELTKASYAEMYTNNALAAYAEWCFSSGSPATVPE